MSTSSQFNSETAKTAGIKSGIARTLKQPARIVETVLQDLLFARELIAKTLKDGECKHCKRSGPKALKDLTELTRQLADLSDQVLNRYRGRPSVESNLERHASVGDYVKALNEQDEILDELEFIDGVPTSLSDPIEPTNEHPKRNTP